MKWENEVKRVIWVRRERKVNRERREMQAPLQQASRVNLESLEEVD